MFTFPPFYFPNVRCRRKVEMGCGGVGPSQGRNKIFFFLPRRPFSSVEVIPMIYDPTGGRGEAKSSQNLLLLPPPKKKSAEEEKANQWPHRKKVHKNNFPFALNNGVSCPKKEHYPRKSEKEIGQNFVFATFSSSPFFVQEIERDARQRKVWKGG